MIYDSLKNICLYKIKDKYISYAFDFLISEDIASFPDGRHSILKDRVYLSVSSYEPKSYKDSLWEMHRRYADIHILIKGEEIIASAPSTGSLKCVRKYSRKNDCALFIGECDKSVKIHLSPKSFVFLLPYELHKPSLRVSEEQKSVVRKAVMKILLH